MLLQIEEEKQEEQEQQQEKERERERERERGRANLVHNIDKDECTISNWFNGFFQHKIHIQNKNKTKPGQ